MQKNYDIKRHNLKYLQNAGIIIIKNLWSSGHSD